MNSIAWTLFLKKKMFSISISFILHSHYFSFLLKNIYNSTYIPITNKQKISPNNCISLLKLHIWPLNRVAVYFSLCCCFSIIINSSSSHSQKCPSFPYPYYWPHLDSTREQKAFCDCLHLPLPWILQFRTLILTGVYGENGVRKAERSLHTHTLLPNSHCLHS